MSKSEAESPRSLKEGLEEMEAREEKRSRKQYLRDLFDARRIKLHPPPPKPPVIFKLLGQQISTPGNLTVITAQAKAGKSSVYAAMLSAMLSADTEISAPDTLGFDALPSSGKAIIAIDTEQSFFDAWRMIFRSSLRLDVPPAQLPDNYRITRTNDLAIKDRKDGLAEDIERAKEDFGGVHVVFVDGIADLCLDLNDTREAFPVIEWLLSLAHKFDCPIILILHENPGPNNHTKMRGHLGSQLERKAETTLRVERGPELTTLYAFASRSSNIPKEKGVSFVWSEEKEMHVIATPDQVQAAQAAQTKKSAGSQQRSDAEEKSRLHKLDWQPGAISYTALRTLVIKALGEAKSTAEKSIQKWAKMGLILKKSGKAGDPESGLYAKTLKATKDEPDEPSF